MVPNTTPSEKEHLKDTDIKLLLFRLLKYWYLLLIFLPVCLSIAYVYLRYADQIYQASATILLAEDASTYGGLTEDAIFGNLGLSQNNKKLQDEMLMFTSSGLMHKVIDELDIQNEYYAEGRIKMADLYDKSPVKVLSWIPTQPNASLSVSLECEDLTTYILNLGKEEYKGNFGKPLKLPSGVLNLSFSPSASKETNYILRINTAEQAAINFSQKLEVTNKRETSALTLSIQDLVPERASDIINTLIKKYDEQDIEEKNRILKNTLKFIDSRIDLLANEIDDVEGDVERFKSHYNLMDMTAEGAQIIGELSSYRRNLEEVDVQLEILNSIEAFLQKNRKSFEFVPTNLSLTNLSLTGLLGRFNMLLEEKEKMKIALGDGHPNLMQIDEQLGNLRETIISNIQSIKKDLLITKQTVGNQKGSLDNRLKSLPTREREFIGIERKRIVKETIYSFLLQKKEETSLAMATATGSARVVEAARIPAAPIKPNRNDAWAIASALGILLPVGLAFLLFFLNDKIDVEGEIGYYTQTPIVGAIAHSPKGDTLVVNNTSRSAVAEMFRLLRANLNYIAAGERLQTVLMTSSTSGEGKSFITLNLAAIQAISGKKVCILEMDLRKPKQELYIGVVERAKVGVSSYIIDHSLTLEDIIRPVAQQTNLFVIASGPKPPNPSELILSQRLRDLVTELREKFDFIVLDGPPVGLVADALQMADLADATLYVVRQGYTRKGQLNIIDDIYTQKKLPRPYIVFNGVDIKSKGYGYGYGYGYYEED